MRINVKISMFAEFERYVFGSSFLTTKTLLSDTIVVSGMDSDHCFMSLVQGVSDLILSHDFVSTVGEVERICFPRLLSCVSRVPSFSQEFCEKSLSDCFVLTWCDVVPDEFVKIQLFKDGDYVVSKLCMLLLDFEVIERE